MNFIFLLVSILRSKLIFYGIFGAEPDCRAIFIAWISLLSNLVQFTLRDVFPAGYRSSGRNHDLFFSLHLLNLFIPIDCLVLINCHGVGTQSRSIDNALAAVHFVELSVPVIVHISTPF